MANIRWKASEIDFLLRHVKDMSFATLAMYLSKTEMAVRLQAHRLHVGSRPCTEKNVVRDLFAMIIDPDLIEITPEFAKRIKMSNKRFRSLYRGEAVPTNEEFCKIADLLRIDRKEALKAKQLNIFEDDTTADY